MYILTTLWHRELYTMTRMVRPKYPDRLGIEPAMSSNSVKLITAGMRLYLVSVPVYGCRQLRTGFLPKPLTQGKMHFRITEAMLMNISQLVKAEKRHVSG